ncbi:MAG: acyl-CoA thioesterase [Flavobacteriia bacterium]|nr:acyl-CoA thioesterase [Flavobacteriia bacterium]
MSIENSTHIKYITAEMTMAVRFSETDAMGVVWHGNYLKFFEDAREFFGTVYQLEYLDFYRNGYFTPIVRSEIEHKAPIHYGEKVKIIIKFHFNNAAKLIFTYEVFNATTGQLAAEGKTVQVFLEKENRTLELIKPSFFMEWENKQSWRV